MMKIKVWGCRGSLPSPGPENNFYGGNTSCVEVTDGETFLILDAGSGIQRLGRFVDRGIKEIHILLTHLHIDHTMGMGFFLPLYDPSVKVHFWGPSSSVTPLLQRLRKFFSPPMFPVRLADLPNHPEIHELTYDDFSIGNFQIHSEYVCHPGPTLGFRIRLGNATLAYIPDHEVRLGSTNFPNNPEWTSGFELANKVDLLFHDGGYTSSEYDQKIGWGHSAVQDSIDFGALCQVKRMAIFHHEPNNTDEQLDAILADRLKERNLNFQAELCREGAEYFL